MNSAIYTGRVFHQRFGAITHRLNYDVFYMLLDLAELPELEQRSRWFGINRRGWFAYYDADHGIGDGRPFAAVLTELLGQAGFANADWTYQLLTMPRVLGFLFNPISVVYCHDGDGQLCAIVYEVNNTFGERILYVVPVSQPRKRLRQRCDKALFVSPFFALSGHYEFSITPPSEELDLVIDYFDAGERRLRASFSGQLRPLASRTLAGLSWRYPLATAKVAAGIHFEAIKLWLKRVPLIKHQPSGGSAIEIGKEL